MEATKRQIVTDAGERIGNVMEELLARKGAKLAFGDPITTDGTTVIPVAEVRAGFGFGSGYGKGGEEKREHEDAVAGGSGGGGGAKVIPLGFIRARGDTVAYEPIVHVTRLALGGMALAAWTAFLVARLILRH